MLLQHILTCLPRSFFMAQQALIDELLAIKDPTYQFLKGQMTLFVRGLSGDYDFQSVTNMGGLAALGYLSAEKDSKVAHKAAAATGEASWTHPLLYPGEPDMTQAHQRVSPVVVNGAECGTVARISPQGVCVSATHVFVEDGKFLCASAFEGCQLKLLASVPFHDIIFLQGPPGPAFEISTLKYPYPGRSVMLLAFPHAPRRDLASRTAPESASDGLINPLTFASAPGGPIEAHGRVVSVAPTAMPNSSGGAVLYDSKSFAGIHLGTTYHEEHVGEEQMEEEDAPRRRVDVNPDAMWASSSFGNQGKRKPQQASAGALEEEWAEKNVKGGRCGEGGVPFQSQHPA